jgi:hypothetical protein
MGDARDTHCEGMRRVEDQVCLLALQELNQAVVGEAARLHLQFPSGSAKQAGACFLPGHGGADKKAGRDQSVG